MTLPHSNNKTPAQILTGNTGLDNLDYLQTNQKGIKLVENYFQIFKHLVASRRVTSYMEDV